MRAKMRATTRPSYFEPYSGGGTVVKRSAGFAPTFEFTAETTVDTAKGAMTVREGGHTAKGAETRAKLEARDREMFAGTRRRAGFTAAGFAAA